MARIAMNGLGRIGKLALRDLVDRGIGGEIVLLNDPPGDAEQHALLMEFDSVHGRWATPVRHGPGTLTPGGRDIRLTHGRALEALPPPALGVDMVIGCTGAFETGAQLAPYFAAGPSGSRPARRSGTGVRSTSSWASIITSAILRRTAS